MKKKKLKKMLNKLKKKSERELDVEVDVLNEKIRTLNNETNDIHDAILTWDKKVNRIDDKLNHVDERTMALDNVKVQRTLDMMKEQLQKAKELDDKIKILMDRTSTNYNACSDTGITFENGYQIIRCMADRGATQEELNNLKDYFNRYVFRCKLFKITLEKEEKNDG